jgi:hypothetical protein
MKKLIPILLILSLCCPVFGATVSGRPCPGGGAATPVVILNETFEGSTACYSGATGDDAKCVVTWTRGGDSATWYHALQAGMPADAGTYGILHDTSNESGELVYWSYGSEVDRTVYNVDIEYSLYINSATITDGSYISITAWAYANNGGNYTNQVRIYNTSGQLSIYGRGVGDSDKTNISTGVWYSVKVHLDTTAAQSYIKIGSGSEASFTLASNNGKYCIIGSITGEGADEAISMEIGHMKVTIYTD